MDGLADAHLLAFQVSPMNLTTEQLLSIAREYWRPDRYQHLTQEPSPEDDKREARWKEVLQNAGQWHAFLTGLKQALPGFTIGDGTATPDACFRCVAYPVKGRIDPKSVGEALKRRRASPDIHRQRGSIPPDGA